MALETQPYEPTLESLRRHRVPEWYQNTKLGIFVHWGLYSVPGWAASRKDPFRIIAEKGFDRYFRENPYAEWYLNTLKFEDASTRAYHNRIFGEHFVYEDFQPIFEREAQKMGAGRLGGAVSKGGRWLRRADSQARMALMFRAVRNRALP